VKYPRPAVAEALRAYVGVEVGVFSRDMPEELRWRAWLPEPPPPGDRHGRELTCAKSP